VIHKAIEKMNMEATVIGTGHPVLILHEWLGDHRNWLPMLEHCDTEKHAFHCLDLPGYGKSKHLEPTPSASSIANLVLAYADNNNIDRFALVGHSMSGLVAHHVGLLAPKRITRLILVSPVPPTGFKATSDNIAAMHRVSGDRVALRNAILARGGHVETDEWVERKTDLAWTASSPNSKAAYLKMFLAPVEPEAQKSEFQSLHILCGELDLPFYKRESLRAEFEPFYSALNIITMNSCGHYPMLQQPNLMASQLEALL